MPGLIGSGPWEFSDLLLPRAQKGKAAVLIACPDTVEESPLIRDLILICSIEYGKLLNMTQARQPSRGSNVASMMLYVE